ncbi:MAG: hypothetical protein JWQ11_4339 [Rhizobacter sp.]|nr:hypothetical protein [Rhizobacter sp.]
MTKPSSSTGFKLSPADPALVLPTLASSAGAATRNQAANQPAGSSVGDARPIPSLIALRGLVGLPDPAVVPDYSRLQALVEQAPAERAPAEPVEPVTPIAAPLKPLRVVQKVVMAPAKLIEPIDSNAPGVAPTASPKPVRPNKAKARRSPQAVKVVELVAMPIDPVAAKAEIDVPPDARHIASSPITGMLRATGMAEPATANSQEAAHRSLPRKAQDAAAFAETSAAPVDPVLPAPNTHSAPIADAPEPRFLESTASFLGITAARFLGLRRVMEATDTPPPPFAGGPFETAAGERLALRKPTPAHDGMNDFIAGMLARVALVDAPVVVPLSFGGDTWLASPSTTAAIDLNEFAQALADASAVDAHTAANANATTPATGAAATATSKPNAIARRPDSHEITRRIVRAFEQCCDKGLEENVAFAMLVGADEQHSGHFVVELEADATVDADAAFASGRRVKRVVRTDCTSASREHQRLHRIRSYYFDHQMHPAPTPRRLPGFGPNQHRVDVPRDLRCSAPYIEALLALSRRDLSQAVRLAFLEAANSWSDDVCRAFAVNANLRLPTRRWTSEALFEECGRAYLQRIEARQKSMQRYAADLAIGLASVDSQSHALTLTRADNGSVLLDSFLRQPEIRPSIDAWLRREPGAARQRNLSLDRHDEALREAVSARLAALS